MTDDAGIAAIVRNLGAHGSSVKYVHDRIGVNARLDAVQAGVLMAFSAVPTASSAYVLAARMGYNGPFVAGLVTLSTLLGVLSLPFALALLQR